MIKTVAVLSMLFLYLNARAQVVINELGIAPAAPAMEFIELYNRSSCPVDLSCYTLAFSSTSGGGNATGWTVKIPQGSAIGGCSYFLIGGISGVGGVMGGTGFPTGGISISYAGADLDIGSPVITSNAVFIRRGLAAGSLPNSSGQLNLLDANGNLVTSVSYNNGNNAGSYPLSAYIECSGTDNVRASNNIPNPGLAINNVNALFRTTQNRGISLEANGLYTASRNLTPGTANFSQVACGPDISPELTTLSFCYNPSGGIIHLPYNSTSGDPTHYSMQWDQPTPFASVHHAPLPPSQIEILVPPNTLAGIYSGLLMVSNSAGKSCEKPFHVVVRPLPVVTLTSSASQICIGDSLILTANGADSFIWKPPVYFQGSTQKTLLVKPPATVSYTVIGKQEGCKDSAIITITVGENKKDTVVACLADNESYFFNGQWLSEPGHYTASYKTVFNCDSIVHLVLNKVKTHRVKLNGCGEVMYNQVRYTSSTVLTDTVRSAIDACDSIINIVELEVAPIPSGFTTACIREGESLWFNGIVLTQPGHYSAIVRRPGLCDSIANIHLTVTRFEKSYIRGCDRVFFNGTWYDSSIQLADTIRNGANTCDSLVRIKEIVVNRSSIISSAVCLPTGSHLQFGNELLTRSGSYSKTFHTDSGCDSTVNLHLVITRQEDSIVKGCGSVSYRRRSYLRSISFRDTIASFLGCDSVIRYVQIKVLPLPSIEIKGDTSVCAGSAVTLQATFDGDLLWSTGDTSKIISVRPAQASVYTVKATNKEGCVSVDSIRLNAIHFKLQLTASQNPAISGPTVTLNTAADKSYRVISWQPDLFSNPAARHQKLVVDSTTLVSVVARSIDNCTDSAHLLIEAEIFDGIYVPSVFTPNGDGKNDLLRILGGSIAHMDWQIWNRWGQLVFATKNRTAGWDGNFGGRPQPSGSFVFYLRVVLKSGSVIHKKGMVTLVR